MQRHRSTDVAHSGRIFWDDPQLFISLPTLCILHPFFVSSSSSLEVKTPTAPRSCSPVIGFHVNEGGPRDQPINLRKEQKEQAAQVQTHEERKRRKESHYIYPDN